MSQERLSDAQDTREFIITRQSENANNILLVQEFLGTPNRNRNELEEILSLELLIRKEFKAEIKALNQERGEALRNKDIDRVNQLDIEISDRQEGVASLDENIKNLRGGITGAIQEQEVLGKELQGLEWERTELESNLRNIDAKIQHIIEQCDLNQEAQNLVVNSDELTIFVPSPQNILDENEDALLVVVGSEANDSFGGDLVNGASEVLLLNIEETNNSQIEIGVVDVTNSLTFDDLTLSTNELVPTENDRVLPDLTTEL